MNRKLQILGVVLLGALTLLLANWACFAFWMTAYYSGDEVVGMWQTRFYMRFGGTLLAFAADVYLIVRLYRSRK
jgi:hypothetical protein